MLHLKDSMEAHMAAAGVAGVQKFGGLGDPKAVADLLAKEGFKTFADLLEVASLRSATGFRDELRGCGIKVKLANTIQKYCLRFESTMGAQPLLEATFTCCGVAVLVVPAVAFAGAVCGLLAWYFLYHASAGQLLFISCLEEQRKGDDWTSVTTWAEDVKCFEKVLDLEPNHVGAHVQIGNLLCDSYPPKDIPGAEKNYRRAIKIDPNCAMAHNNLGILLKNHKKNLAGAAKAYRRAIEIDPKYYMPYFNLGMLLESKKDIAGAEVCLRPFFLSFSFFVFSYF
jgi:tetratricopeptide (TPR) repeat protein